MNRSAISTHANSIRRLLIAASLDLGTLIAGYVRMDSGFYMPAGFSHSAGLPLLAQFGGTKNYWVDLIVIVIFFGLAVFAVGRASRRY